MTAPTTQLVNHAPGGPALDVVAWLRTFRKTTPRERRQALIDRLNVDTTLANVTGAPAALRDEAYSIIVYVLAARAIGHPATTSELSVSRARLVGRVAKTFDLPWSAVAEDLRVMMRRLDHDHRQWLRRREKPAAVDG